jgi:hypothetical protein
VCCIYYRKEKGDRKSGRASTLRANNATSLVHASFVGVCASMLGSAPPEHKTPSYQSSSTRSPPIHTPIAWSLISSLSRLGKGPSSHMHKAPPCRHWGQSRRAHSLHANTCVSSPQRSQDGTSCSQFSANFVLLMLTTTFAFVALFRRSAARRASPRRRDQHVSPTLSGCCTAKGSMVSAASTISPEDSLTVRCREFGSQRLQTSSRWSDEMNLVSRQRWTEFDS